MITLVIELFDACCDWNAKTVIFYNEPSCWNNPKSFNLFYDANLKKKKGLWLKPAITRTIAFPKGKLGQPGLCKEELAFVKLHRLPHFNHSVLQWRKKNFSPSPFYWKIYRDCSWCPSFFARPRPRPPWRDSCSPVCANATPTAVRWAVRRWRSCSCAGCPGCCGVRTMGKGEFQNWVRRCYAAHACCMER